MGNGFDVSDAIAPKYSVCNPKTNSRKQVVFPLPGENLARNVKTLKLPCKP